MGGFSLWHWIIVLVVVLVLFGRGRVSDVMGEFGKGIKSFKDGMADEASKAPVTPPSQITPPPAAPAAEAVKTPSDSGTV
jgi:sec-independent protein translocase protein TatA